MKAFLLLALISCVFASQPFLFHEEVYQQAFGQFVQEFGKKYSHENLFYRYSIFKRNVDFIHLHNEKNLSYTLGMNAFGDMTFDEFHSTHTGLKPIHNNFIRSKNAPTSVSDPNPDPPKVDWRTKGAVTPVKDQGMCGSCWAFSATGSMEGAWQIKSKKTIVSISEQQLVDCSWPEGNQGCNGGLMDQAFEYVIHNKGITTEALYPYTAKDGNCKSPLPKSAVTISSYTDVTANKDSAMQTAVAAGPVSVAIEADQEVFQFYKSGVFDDASCGTQLDHGVLAVGYDTDAKSKKNYWIVKNSWGLTWGNQGYIWMVRKDGPGQCGINMMSSYPVV